MVQIVPQNSDELTLRALVMDYAFSEASRLNHDFIGSEHLLVACFRLGDKSIEKIARMHGITVRLLRKLIKRIVGTGCKTMDQDELTLTPRAIKALEISEIFALNSNEAWDVWHLLLGLIQDRQSVCVQLLFELGLDDQKLDDISNADSFGRNEYLPP